MYTIINSIVYSIVVSVFVAGIQVYNPRLFLQDYPKDVIAKVPPKTQKEKRQTILIGIVFMAILLGWPLITTIMLKVNNTNLSFASAFINAFGILFAFNLFDLLVNDLLIFRTWTPKYLVIPGSEGMKGYKSYGLHFKGFFIGTFLSGIAGAIVSLIVVFIVH